MRFEPRRTGLALPVLALAALAAACSTYGSGPAREMATTSDYDVGMVQAASIGDSRGVPAIPFTLGRGGWEDVAVVTDFDFPAAPPEGAPPPRRFLVYSGAFSLATGDVPAALEAARKMAEDLGGYFQSLQENVITLRVPAARWEEALGRLPGLGRILSRRMEARDVTDEVVDLELRLKNARALGDRLTELLSKAKTVEETLAVEKELTRIRTEIERLEGKLAVLRDRVAYSTLVLTFVAAEDAPARAQALPFPWLRELGLEHVLDLPGGAR